MSKGSVIELQFKDRKEYGKRGMYMEVEYADKSQTPSDNIYKLTTAYNAGNTPITSYIFNDLKTKN